MDSSGSLRALEQVWLNEGGVATIIPLKQLEKLCPVVYNSTRNGGTFIRCTKDNKIVLKNNGKGMPYLDLREFEAEFCPLRPKRLCPLCRRCEGTWKDSPSVKSKKRERLARHKQCWGSGMISNCPVTANAVKNTHQIFSPDLAGITGRTVRRPRNLSPPITCKCLGSS